MSDRKSIIKVARRTIKEGVQTIQKIHGLTDAEVILVLTEEIEDTLRHTLRKEHTPTLSVKEFIDVMEKAHQKTAVSKLRFD